ncbi:MAG TPA: TauD/TfdA family dioxygenase [Acidimicrobiales bacterium]|nr:TauD/TfdA family dioxygenase [Acidimicrobiales bacterium]
MASAPSTPAYDVSPSGVTVEPIAGRIGAEITGVDLSQPLDDGTVETIQRALDQWKVVFFRDQHLDHAAQIDFGRRFGELTYAHPHDDTPPDGAPEIYTVDVRRFVKGDKAEAAKIIRAERRSLTSGWHTDVTPAVNPPAGSILRADIVPAVGGDTTWTNLVAAYEGLSEPVKAFVDTLWAEHRYGADWNGLNPDRKTIYGERYKKNSLVAHHPVVRVHPRTGERALFVNPGFVDHILGVSRLESRWILGHLFNELIRPEYTVRFRWQPGSVAFWDNRATSHLAPRDVDGLETERVLHRVTLIGEIPVGPDGRQSELVEGVPFVSTPVFAPAD